jgi:hypothetical protein
MIMEKKKISKEDLDRARTRLYMIMLQHVGPDRKVGMGQLFREVFKRPWKHRINDTRLLRKLITEMRNDGQAVMSSTSSSRGGYWIASSASELNAYTEKEKKAAIKVLARLARMKKVSLPDYLGQMKLELEARNDI